MKSLLKAFSVVALSGAMVLPVLADDAKDQKDLKKVIEDQGINYVETAQKGIVLSGYVDVSYTEQFAGTGEYGTVGNAGGGPANVHANLRQFDTNNNNFNVQAVKIALEKALPDKNDWAAGFRIDTIYGADAKYLGDSAFNSSATETSTSNNSGLALEQALVKFRVPVGNGLDFYVGKFVTLLGYEVIESPANLNFSRGLLFTNAIPLTNTGFYMDYKFNDTVEAKLGLVDGWNNSTSSSVSQSGDNEFSNGTIKDDNSFGKAITGQINITAPGKNANICQSFIYSPEGEPGNTTSVDNGPYVVYDIWGNWNPTFVKDSALLLGFNIDLGYNGASGSPQDGDGSVLGEEGPGGYDSNTWWGGALYASYKFNKVFTLSGRLEYLHSDSAWFPKYGPQGGVTDPNTGNLVPVSAQDDYSATLTASFNIWDNLLTRIEYRVDDLSGSSSTASVGSDEESSTVAGKSAVQQEVSLEAVYSF